MPRCGQQSADIYQGGDEEVRWGNAEGLRVVAARAGMSLRYALPAQCVRVCGGGVRWDTERTQCGPLLSSALLHRLTASSSLGLPAFLSPSSSPRYPNAYIAATTYSDI